MGAAVLWLTSAVEPLDHLALMIPVLDWRTMALAPAELAAHNRRVARTPAQQAAQVQAWLSISPVSYPSRVPADRVLLQYGQLDQLTPASVSMRFCVDRGCRARGYARSHATILLSSDVFDDYEAFLGQLPAATAGPEAVP